jgi:hypothetical protein
MVAFGMLCFVVVDHTTIGRVMLAALSRLYKVLLLWFAWYLLGQGLIESQEQRLQIESTHHGAPSSRVLQIQREWLPLLLPLTS